MEYGDTTRVKTLELSDIVDLSIDNDPLRHIVSTRFIALVSRVYSQDRRVYYAVSRVNELDIYCMVVVRTFATSSRVNVFSSFDILTNN